MSSRIASTFWSMNDENRRSVNDDGGKSMSYPTIPEEIAPFLKYSRQVATAIARNESMVGIMKPLFNRMVKKHPEIQETLERLTFDDIARALTPYRDHPEYGVPVQVVIEGGRDWIEWHLRELRKEFL